MKRKILLYYIILILIGMAVTGLFVSEMTQNLYKNEVRHRLLAVDDLFDHELSEINARGDTPDYNDLAKSYAEVLHASDNASRITIIDLRGKVLGETQADYQQMENHLSRKEVQQALSGGIGEDTRYSATLKTDFLYIAIPSKVESVIIRAAVPLVQLSRIDRQIWWFTLIGILAGLLLTVLLALRFASSLSRPVMALTEAAKEITGGNYSRRVTVSTPGDEVGQLAAAFNEMAGELESTVADLTDKNMKFDTILNSMTNLFFAVDSNQRIILINSHACQFFDVKAQDVLGRQLIGVIRNRRINEIVLRTIDENQPLDQEFSLSTPEEGILRIFSSPIRSSARPDKNVGCIVTMHDITAIKKLEQIRTEFVSNVTHELKTPLTSIRGFVETLRSGAVEDEEVKMKFLEIIDIEADRLTMLINDILQLSEIENRLSDVNIKRHSLSGITQEVISILQGSADKKKVRLSAEVDSSITIMANRDRIKQMLINLIDNAINYNVENGSVVVRAAKLEGRIQITVSDTGIGIAQQHLARIFERFYRVDKGRSRNMGGTGLGLSIVKHIVNLYDGDLRVESEPGKGTRFTIQLPDE